MSVFTLNLAIKTFLLICFPFGWFDQTPFLIFATYKAVTVYLFLKALPLHVPWAIRKKGSTSL